MDADESIRGPAVPPPQRNLQQAAARALAVVRGQPVEQLRWLGARARDDRWDLPVLEELLSIDLDDGAVRTSEGRPVGPFWQVLTLHYLSTSGRPAAGPPSVSFAHLPSGMAYAGVYRQRVIERLCRTVGREGDSLRRAARALGGRAVSGGDAGFDFQPYPRIRIRLVWYAGDDELPPSGVMLLPQTIEAFLTVEDIVVLSERIVSRLSGGRF